jgi:hypothetical protein
MTGVTSRVTKTASVLALVLALLTGPTPARAYTEEDFLRQSKFCEAATRLPWGDVDSIYWFDCMKYQGRLRTDEEQNGDAITSPESLWLRQLSMSLLWATEDGCSHWASTQPSDDRPRLQRGLWTGVWTQNGAWNRCMERAGLFGPAQR